MMSYSWIEKFERRQRQSRDKRRALMRRYDKMLLSRLEREGTGIADPAGNAVFRDMMRAVYRFNRSRIDE